MSTIKDIAEMAGVSYGTVSNVLNGRGNVSAKKIKLVEEATQKLGYQLNLQAKILKEGFAKTVSVILPNINSEQYYSLYDGLFNELSEQGYELSLYLTHDAKERELQFIQKIATKRDSAVIVVSCLASAESYYQTVKTDKSKIIFVYRKPDFAEQFVSLNFVQAGHDIADAIMAKYHHRIGLFSNATTNANSHSLKEGLLQRFKQAQYDVELYHVESVPSDRNYNLAFSFFNRPNIQFDAIITSDIDRAHYIRNANYFGSQSSCPPIYTLANDNFFYEDNFYQYHMNYGMLSKKIVSTILGEVDTDNIIKNKGFLFFSDNHFLPKNTEHKQSINFLILPSPSTEAVRKLLPHFKKQTGIDVNLIVKSFDEIYHIFNQLDEHADIDIVRIDMASLPWFAPSILKPLSALQLDLPQLLSHYSPQVTERFTYINQIAYGIPFDPSIQMLFYRRDLFEDPLIKRLYFEKYRQNLDIPVNFAQFAQINEFFDQRRNPDSPIQFGSTITLGNSEIIASEFLLRYYANGGTLVNGLSVALNEKITVNTLNQLKIFMQSANNLDATWWQRSVEEFEQGNSAMLIVYMNLFSYLSTKNILPLIGYSSVPGNMPLFGGGSLAMSRYSQKIEEVSAFFNWIFSPEISEQVALLGGAVAQDNIFQNQKIISNYPWVDVSHKNYLYGIRENQLSNGQAINLRKIESIIGQHIDLWLKLNSDCEEMITMLNEQLQQESYLL